MLFNFRGVMKGARDCKKRHGGYLGLCLAGKRTRALLPLLLFALGPHPPFASAQELDPSALFKPPTDTWPTYNGDYSGKRFSTLDQINAGNINSLTLAWAFSTHSTTIKSTPLEVNGILYFSVPDNVWAVDARFGRRIWHYERKSEGDHIGHRGLAMYKNWLYFTTPDAHLICLDAKDGTVRWDMELADPKLEYFSTMAPLVVRDHVIVGVSGDVTDIPGFLESLDPETGKIQWRWNTEPEPGKPGSETWPKDSDAILHGGGMTWMTGTYDSDLNLLYWGTGNPNPVLAGEGRPGDNLYTCSIVALNPDTGKLVWYFQPSPHDVHDWDAVETPVLFDAEFKGKQRKLLAQASRNGFFFVLDRTNGEHLVTSQFIDQSWASGIDSRGRPIAKPEATPTPDGALVEPGSDGSTNWMAPSFDPQTGLFYVNCRRLFSIYYNTAEGKPEGWGGRDRNLWANSTLRALDYRTGKVVWNHEIGDGESIAGILTTAGHLLFSADNSGNLLALDPATGKTLWHLNAGGKLDASPMTYELEGRQYLILAVQDVLYAFALPAPLPSR
ncbi:MAG TPA: acido-empty-quinoprotein group A [Verrucomicrobiae bacterium]|jgi:acido-empty-quinoprotein group A|nr:acido-empty-quinoprotein group A [Verrucomicrobiae bacterium]